MESPVEWVNDKQLHVLDSPVAVEQLVFEVRAGAVDLWTSTEFEMWTKGLADRCPGLLSKEVWMQDRGEWFRMSVVIYWRTLDEWQGIDTAWLEANEAAFIDIVGADNVRFIHAGHDTGSHYFKISEYR
jgi:uncharacterized protein (TIGR03792 family)